MNRKLDAWFYPMSVSAVFLGLLGAVIAETAGHPLVAGALFATGMFFGVVALLVMFVVGISE